MRPGVPFRATRSRAEAASRTSRKSRVVVSGSIWTTRGNLPIEEPGGAQDERWRLDAGLADRLHEVNGSFHVGAKEMVRRRVAEPRRKVEDDVGAKLTKPAGKLGLSPEVE